jgi:hypothetical protein
VQAFSAYSSTKDHNTSSNFRRTDFKRNCVDVKAGLHGGRTQELAVKCYSATSRKWPAAEQSRLLQILLY